MSDRIFRDRRDADACRPARDRRTRRARPGWSGPIGVIYQPETERNGYYCYARVAERFDALIHVDETRAVEPLERTGRRERGEAPETYPFAV